MGIVVRPDVLPVLPGAFEVRVTVRGEQTDGVVAVIEETLQPRSFITPHMHSNDVWVYVLSGTVGALVGDVIDEATTGQWILKPRNIAHAMWNAAEIPARIIETLTPAGSERWFEELSTIKPGDDDEFTALAARYGITFLRDSTWTEVIRRRFGV